MAAGATIKHFRESDFNFLWWRSDPLSGRHDSAKFQPGFEVKKTIPNRLEIKKAGGFGCLEKASRNFATVHRRLRKGEKLQPANK